VGTGVVAKDAMVITAGLAASTETLAATPLPSASSISAVIWLPTWNTLPGAATKVIGVPLYVAAGALRSVPTCRQSINAFTLDRWASQAVVSNIPEL